MDFLKKFKQGIILVCLISAQNITSTDWIEKLSEIPWTYPMIVQSAFFLGMAVTSISNACFGNNTKKIIDESVDGALKKHLSSIKQELSEIRTKTDIIPEIETKVNSFDGRLADISSKIDPVFAYVQSSHATMPLAVKNLTEAIQMLHNEGLPELEKRMNEKFDQKLDDIRSKITTIDPTNKINSLTAILESNNRDLDVKISAYILQSNLFMAKAADDIKCSKTNAIEALKKIEELKNERLQLTALSQATQSMPVPFPELKLSQLADRRNVN